MTTISTTPTLSINFNRSGTTITEMTATVGTVQPIAYYSAHTIIISNAAVNVYAPDGYELPAAAEIGDVVEIYEMSGKVVGVMAPAGEDIRTYPNGQVGPGSSRKFLKYSATSWTTT